MTPLFDHTYIDNQVSRTLVVLHGTGGSKSDFLFFDQLLNHSFNILALQGNLSEHGLSRFFKRLAMGVFDQESIKKESKRLHEFMTNWQKKYGQKPEDYVYLGYSNGANMILATLFYFPSLITTAVLLHPMLPFTPTAVSLKEKRLFITHGLDDALVSQQQQDAVTNVLKEKSALIIKKDYPAGHQLSNQEIQDVTAFLEDCVNLDL